jgi:hypothetical protein
MIPRAINPIKQYNLPLQDYIWFWGIFSVLYARFAYYSFHLVFLKTSTNIPVQAHIIAERIIVPIN